jgi:hypothetical protein
MGHFQTSLAEIGLLPGKVTRRAEFFERLDRLVPWERWVAIVDARRRVPGGAGRRPVATETTLRMLVAQRCLNLSDEECEDQRADSRALSTFLGSAKVPDKTTLCRPRTRRSRRADRCPTSTANRSGRTADGMTYATRGQPKPGFRTTRSSRESAQPGRTLVARCGSRAGLLMFGQE